MGFFEDAMFTIVSSLCTPDWSRFMNSSIIFVSQLHAITTFKKTHLIP